MPFKEPVEPKEDPDSLKLKAVAEQLLAWRILIDQAKEKFGDFGDEWVKLLERFLASDDSVLKYSRGKQFLSDSYQLRRRLADTYKYLEEESVFAEAKNGPILRQLFDDCFKGFFELEGKFFQIDFDANGGAKSLEQIKEEAMKRI